jgi:alginate biosynthesis protein AlgX
MIRTLIAGAAMAALLAASPALAATSAFGCKNLEANPTLPSVEGKDGFFFRIFADLRMQHPFTEDTTTQMGKLAEALRAHGTTLLYVPVPTKSVTLPTFLPEEAVLFGFDEKVAAAVYADQIERLRAKGVVAIDLLSALRTTDGENPPFFKSDFHWTSDGARKAAETIGGTIKTLPGYEEVTPVHYESKVTGSELAVSGMRRTLQAYCALNLPPVISTAYETVEVASADATLDIFGESSGAEGAAANEIALVGTSFSDAQVPNFAGFLAEYASMPVSNMAITGGNQFGAVVSYLTSREFQRNRPRFIVWENPIYNNLAQFGTGPMTELIAAARDDCRPLGEAPVIDKAAGVIEADLTGTSIAPSQVLLADAGDNGSRDVVLSFTSADGRTFTREVHRGDRFRGTGRFFVPLESLDSLELAKVSIKFDRLSEEAAAIAICNT